MLAAVSCTWFGSLCAASRGRLRCGALFGDQSDYTRALGAHWSERGHRLFLRLSLIDHQVVAILQRFGRGVKEDEWMCGRYYTIVAARCCLKTVFFVSVLLSSMLLVACELGI